MVEWVEVRGKSIDVAVTAAMAELGITDRERVQVEVIQEPEKGFLGLGGRDAIVRVKPKPAGNRRRKRTGRGTSREGDRRSGQARGPSATGERRDQTRRPSDRSPRGERSRPATPRPTSENQERPAIRREERVSTADPHAQAPMVAEFLEGLVDAFGLEGEVTVAVEDDVVVARISGEQTEALVGARGTVMESIHEITKTVLHRAHDDTARVRLDIAGYAERRRQALSIYAGQLIDQVLAEGGEIMLEPMSAADRKVIHDAVAAREGVRSYSEGEAPRRYVVIARVDEPEDQGVDSPDIEPEPAVSETED
ncbi:MAG TPA: RNA-binding cell elongation regulator Jag/EloR [Acidimicrobiia bacterium]|nr:RNA-binding cell elongation regulator Jag/EloR [Acidimicrobiia bacterium]